ncbi:MAG TPA: TetR/AcrR family transcriptional regulator [Candidatus Krumholzibacteria bacterium]|nr:TetR/AcrR family transcriptional regulator [Candidatus Krumholzibacteria bacterium]HPD71880.1 TetR/AcrR family transcriptional regulator [Candidatus Krumholzibacteria bacterium]HRY41187.1 TetR/AcrR family transcriptional regulator [Candidatus Krumholzibacteria bacterium]
MPTRASSHSQLRRCRHRDIVGAATDLFLSRGYAQTTMAMVARHAGCSVGHLYRHADGKRELLDAVIASQVETIDGLRRAVRSEPGLSPLARLRRLLQVLCSHLCEHPQLVAIVTTTDLVSSMAQPTFRERAEREDAELFRLAIEAGEIAGEDPRQLAAALYGIASSLVSLTDARRVPEHFAAIPAVVDRLFLEPLTANAKRPAPDGATGTRQ